MSQKKTFVTLEQLKEINKTYPTPYHLYDEKGIRANAERLKKAFSWNKGYREYFAIKATPNPYILKILKDYGCGVDCASMTELMMAYALDYKPEEIMFSSNDTPAEEYAYAYKLGATINLDDITHIDFLEDTIGTIPKRISCRYNPEFSPTQTIGSEFEIVSQRVEGDRQDIILQQNTYCPANNLLSRVLPQTDIISYQKIIPSMNDIFIKLVKEQA